VQDFDHEFKRQEVGPLRFVEGMLSKEVGDGLHDSTLGVGQHGGRTIQIFKIHFTVCWNYNITTAF
jgi:hypothetical protein